MANIEDKPAVGSTDAHPAITAASAPFDHADADVILRSSDNVDFKVFKLLLSLGSPFFKDMFALPQASKGDPSSEIKDGLPVVQVTERRKVLEALLVMCYPMGAADPPALEKLEDVDSLLEAAIKYNFERVEKRAREMLVGPLFLDTNSVRVFAIACRYRMEEEARLAARASLSESILQKTYGPELEFMTAGKLLRLLQYHENSVTAARNTISNFSWPGSVADSNAGTRYVNCDHCGSRIQTGGKIKDPLQAAISTTLWTRVPKRVEIEAAMEERDRVVTCGNCSNLKSLAGGVMTYKMVRESVSLFCAQMESAISSVGLELQL